MTASMNYHHGDARSALLKAAAGLLETEGAAGLSLRQVAEKAGLSRQAPYNHFANKEALLADLAADGFRTLTERMKPAFEDASPFDRLVAAADGYIGFAKDHPARFRLMFGRELVDLRANPAAQAAADDAFAVLSGIIASIAPSDQFQDLRLVAWSLVHGYSELCLEADIQGTQSEREPATLFARTVMALKSCGSDHG